MLQHIRFAAKRRAIARSIWSGADDCLSAIFAGRPSLRLPSWIERYMADGVSFADIFREYGFNADGLGLLPNFYEIHRGK